MKKIVRMLKTKKEKKNRKEEILIIQGGNYSYRVYNGDFREKGKET